MGQTIFRKRYSSNYTSIPNKYTRDSSLSWKAKGILTHLLTLPQDWEVNASYLSDQSTDGLSSVYAGLSELIEKKYLWRRPRCGKVMGGYEVFVYDEPHDKNPFEENAGLGFSRTGNFSGGENQLQISNEIKQSKEKEQKKKQDQDDWIIPKQLNVPEFLEVWSEYITHRKEKKKKITPTNGSALLKRMSEWGSARAIEALRNSVTNGWLGVFPPKEEEWKPTTI